MQTIHKLCLYPELLAECVGHCECCRGLCCTALYFAKSEGFPADKLPGTPCPHLRQSDFRCAIHPQLQTRGLKGCMAYDCFGAGQVTAERISSNPDHPSAPSVFDVFLIVFRLRQMLWYLLEAASLIPAEPLAEQIDSLIAENQRLTKLEPEKICSLNWEDYRQRVNAVLKQTILFVHQSVNAGMKRAPSSAVSSSNLSQKKRPQDLMGKNFKGADLSGEDLGMTLLIAANLSHCRLYGTNFLGADLRDANLDGADLSECVFLTREQLASARLTSSTKLPINLQLLSIP